MRAQHVKRGSDWLIARLAEAQHGVVARRQLLVLGLTREAIQVRIEGGRLLPVHRGVYAVGHRRLTQGGRWMAAVLAVGSGAVLSHRSAAALWGLVEEFGDVDVSSPRNARPRRGTNPRRVPSLNASQCTTHERIPCTTIARTLLDLAATARPATLKKAVKESEYRRIFDLGEIESLFEAEPRHRGRCPLESALSELAIGIAVTRSELENRFLDLLIEAGLPRPEVNARLTLDDGTAYVIDFLWRDRRLAVETDGFDAHVRESSFNDDSRRDLRLRGAGFHVMRFTWPDVTERPAEVVANLRTRL